ncbi:MAG: tyrosine-type recombinase/integrase [Bacteroidales bacterium]|nr:tyrosine-type recombinase/integrase [Candidatus Equimonas faecalis]
MAKPEKRNGKWRVRVYLYTDAQNKKHYKSVTADTKAECMYLAALAAQEKPKGTGERAEDLTVRQAIDRYINLSATLSPTTLAAYRKVRDHAFPGIMDAKVSSLDDVTMQEAINEEMSRTAEKTGKPLSPKTIKNEWGVISGALHTICKRTYDIRLPKYQPQHADLPEPAEIMRAVSGSKVELPSLLAMWLSLSMSEIKGLTAKSIHGLLLTIDQVMVDVNGAEVIKNDAKTVKRKRTVILSTEIAEMINNTDAVRKLAETGENGPLIPMTRNEIYYHFKRQTKANGLELSFHDLRHVYASTMLTKLGAPSKVVQDAGGWSSNHVMDRVYSNMFSQDREEWAQKRDDYFRECTKNMTTIYDQGTSNT